jgi:DNA-binding HxlR family transcriptional regulator
VEYSLTSLGRDVAAKLFDLIELLEDRMPEVMAARASHEMRR